MAEKTFGETLINIREYDLDNRVERIEEATKQGVILPLLNRVGWDTEDIAEVYPEFPVSKDKVDYALRIGNANQVFVEAKSWGWPLGPGEEGQLDGYIRAAKPRPHLGVLTNGRQWSLYLGPGRGRNQKIRLFLEFDITTVESAEVESQFRKFLAKDRWSSTPSAKETASDALERFREMQSISAVTEAVKDALGGLTLKDLGGLVAEIVERNQGTQVDSGKVSEILNSLGVTPPVIAEPPLGKVNPDSLIFQVGNEKLEVDLVKKFWYPVLVGVCDLMQKRHPDTFASVLDLKGFGQPGEGVEINGTGIHVRHPGTTPSIRKTCADVLAKFGYPPTSLIIKLKDGRSIPVWTPS